MRPAILCSDRPLFMNKQPLHYALRRRYDGIQTRGVNAICGETKRTASGKMTFFCSGGVGDPMSALMGGKDVSFSFKRREEKVTASRQKGLQEADRHPLQWKYKMTELIRQ